MLFGWLVSMLLVGIYWRDQVPPEREVFPPKDARPLVAVVLVT